MTWDTEEWRKARDERLRAWMLGNENAVRLCLQMSHIAEVWDDLRDGDRKPTEQELAHAFESAMIHLQGNPLYMQNHGMFWGFVVLAINAWHDANEWESGSEAQRMEAFFLRNRGTEVVMLCALLVGGYDHMRAISNEVREYFRHETFKGWDHETLAA